MKTLASILAGAVLVTIAAWLRAAAVASPEPTSPTTHEPPPRARVVAPPAAAALEPTVEVRAPTAPEPPPPPPPRDTWTAAAPSLPAWSRAAAARIAKAAPAGVDVGSLDCRGGSCRAQVRAATKPALIAFERDLVMAADAWPGEVTFEPREGDLVVDCFLGPSPY